MKKLYVALLIVSIFVGVGISNDVYARLDDADTADLSEGASTFGDDEGSGGLTDDEGGSSWTDDEGQNRSGVTLRNPLQAKNITELFQTIIDIALVFAIPLIVFFIIYAGFLYVTARGNEGTIEKAHKALLYALIGGLLILGANVLIQVVQGTVDCVRDLEGECSS